MHAYDIAAGIHKGWFAPGKTTIWGGYTRDEDGVGGFTRNAGDPSRSIWDGKVDAAGSGQFFPNLNFASEITSAETTKWYLAADQAINSAAMNLFIAYQHIEPEVSLVARCDAGVCGTSTGSLKRVPLALEDFDVFYTGARIQF